MKDSKILTFIMSFVIVIGGAWLLREFFLGAEHEDILLLIISHAIIIAPIIIFFKRLHKISRRIIR